jgi:hypothetical protein
MRLCECFFAKESKIIGIIGRLLTRKPETAADFKLRADSGRGILNKKIMGEE